MPIWQQKAKKFIVPEFVLRALLLALHATRQRAAATGLPGILCWEDSMLTMSPLS